LDLLEIFRTYFSLPPSPIEITRFFLGFRNGKCTRQAVGINTIGGMPKKIADFLNLPNSSNYTGHCFRRTSATLLADAGADITVLKRHGGWRSNTVAEGYICRGFCTKQVGSIFKNIRKRTDHQYNPIR
jgi:integrase